MEISIINLQIIRAVSDETALLVDLFYRTVSVIVDDLSDFELCLSCSLIRFFVSLAGCRAIRHLEVTGRVIAIRESICFDSSVNGNPGIDIVSLLEVRVAIQTDVSFENDRVTYC